MRLKLKMWWDEERGGLDLDLLGVEGATQEGKQCVAEALKTALGAVSKVSGRVDIDVNLSGEILDAHICEALA